MTTIVAIIIFILGTAIGSFLSVLLYRTKSKQKIILSRSICPACKKQLKWRHLVPIFSWIFLRGKCAYCGKKISVHYLALEIISGALFLLAFLKWNFLLIIPSTVDPSYFSYAIDWRIFEIFVFYLIEFSFLIAIFFYDLMHKEIPDRFSLPAIAIAIAGGLIFEFPSSMQMLMGGATVGLFFALQFLVSRGKWIGGGDIRLGVLMGVLLGFEKGLLALVIAYLLGGILSIILLISKKVSRKTAIPFGPFLIIALLISLFYGQQIMDWYFTSLTF